MNVETCGRALIFAARRSSLPEVNLWHVQEVYDAMKAAGRAPRTIQYAHTLLSAALDLAVGADLIPKNPAKFTERPTGKTKEITFFDEKQAGEFLKAAQGDRLFAMFHFALANGPRPSPFRRSQDLTCASRPSSQRLCGRASSRPSSRKQTFRRRGVRLKRRRRAARRCARLSSQELC